MMENLEIFIDGYNFEILLVVLALLIIIFISLIIQSARIASIRNKYNKMFNEVDVNNLEEMLIYNKNKLNTIEIHNKEIAIDLNQIKNDLVQNFSKIETYYYDAFSDIAGKLSFVYVLLNKDNTGVILNGIYSKEGHYLYLKNIKEGKSDKELSKEESITLEKALRKV